MYCINCGNEVPIEAKYCAKCGAAVGGQPAPTPVLEPPKGRASQPSKKKNLLATIVSFGVVVLYILIKICVWRMGDAKSAAQVDSAVKTGAQAIVREQLKAPSTAAFSNVEIEDKDEYGRYLVTLTVDAQNGFGAMLRSQWVVVLRYTGGDRYSYNRNFAAMEYETLRKLSWNDPMEFAKSMNDWSEEPQKSDSD